jgi:[acyl-carrier-protein] S-malonyltransferase
VNAWLFPGQGSQRPGMASDLEACRDLFPVAHSILGADLEALCTRDKVDRWPVHLIQPAIFTTSVGALVAAEVHGLEADAVAGHSLGEFAALVACGVVDFEDGLHLVDVRGKAMASAARDRPGGMVAVIGLDPLSVQEVCEDIGELWVANFNSPSQTVISGKEKSLARAARMLLEAGALRVIRLEVPVPAHTPLMEPAAAKMAEALGRVELKPPRRRFYSVVDGGRHDDPREIGNLIVEAITSPVRFGDTVANMHADGVRLFVEVGPGRALRGLVRQGVSDASVAGIGRDQDAQALAEAEISAGVSP